ncbi:MAG: hypothetical protein FWE31_00465 [Firmicutes bacterium]|nr:hypothetical protein [Bacillota bacterium]
MENIENVDEYLLAHADQFASVGLDINRALELNHLIQHQYMLHRISGEMLKNNTAELTTMIEQAMTRAVTKDFIHEDEESEKLREFAFKNHPFFEQVKSYL